MAWQYFPVARGQMLTADMLNELRTAHNERGLAIGTIPWARGQSVRTLANFLGYLRTQITTNVGSYGYWDGSDFWTFTTDRTNAWFKLKNIFEYVFGAGVTNWPSAVPLASATGLVDALNHTYQVVDALRCYVTPGTLTSGVSEESYRHVYGHTCSGALTALARASYSSQGYYYLHLIEYAYTMRGHAMQYRSPVIRSQSLPFSAANKFWGLSSLFTYGRRKALNDLYHMPQISYYGLARDLYLEFRYGLIPSTWAAAQGGNLLLSYAMPTGTQKTSGGMIFESGDVNISAAALGCIWAIVSGGSDPTGAGVCSIYSRPDGWQASACESVGFGSIGGGSGFLDKMVFRMVLSKAT